MTPVAATLSNELIAFLETLRHANFAVSVENHITVQHLLLRLATENPTAWRLSELKTWIGPIVCRSAEEQREFSRRFDEWTVSQALTQRDQSQVPLVKTEGQPGDSAPGFVDQIRHETRTIKRWWMAAGAIWLLAVGFYFFVVPRLQAPKEADLIVEDPTSLDKSAQPLEGHSETKTGTSPKPVEPKNGSNEVSNGNAFRPMPELGDDTNPESDPHESVALWESPYVEPEVPPPTEGGDPSGSEVLGGKEPATPDVKRALPVVFLIGAVCSILALIATVSIYRRFARRFLVRRSSRQAPELVTFALGTRKNFDLFHTPTLFRAAQQLRRHRLVPVPELDVQRTIQGQLDNGGLFQPVYGVRQAQPEYLLLINQETSRDLQARLIEELIEELKAIDVSTRTYYFEQDAEYCFGKTEETMALCLEEIASRYSDHRLLVFTDWETFLHPATGNPAPWIEKLDLWSEWWIFAPAVMSPEQERIRRRLEHEGLRVFPIHEAGLSMIAEEVLSGPSTAHRSPLNHTILPQGIASRSRRWMEPDKPEAEPLEKFTEELRAYLDDSGLYWLSGCAVYPELHWELTLHLGSKLRDGSGKAVLNRSRLEALVRLPWFRFGHMPDWLRTHLIGLLSKDQEQAVRGLLEELFLSATLANADRGQIQIARERSPVASTLLRRLLRRAWLDNPHDSPVREYVFQSFMNNPLSVRLPRTVNRLLESSSPLRKFSMASGLVVAACLLIVLGWMAGKEFLPSTPTTKELSSDSANIVNRTPREDVPEEPPPGEPLDEPTPTRAPHSWDVPGGIAVNESDPKKLAKSLGVKWCLQCHAFKPGSDLPLGGFENARLEDEWVQLDEGLIWANSDLHQGAYGVLLNGLSQQMARKLDVLDENKLPIIHRDLRCIACHSGIPLHELEQDSNREGLIAESLVKKEELIHGVTCEGCHGPAGESESSGGWYVSHISKRTWRFLDPKVKSEDYGYYNLHSTVSRTRLCTSCHIGNAKEGRVLTHEMLAAGHPPLLGVELETYCVQEPRHWREFQDKPKELIDEYLENTTEWQKTKWSEDDMHRTRSMMVGACITLSEHLKLTVDLADPEVSLPIPSLDRSQEKWPERVQFACASCHADLINPDLQRELYSSGPMLPYWPIPLVLAACRTRAAGFADNIVNEIEDLYHPFYEGEELVRRSEELARELDQLAAQLEDTPLPRSEARNF